MAEKIARSIEARNKNVRIQIIGVDAEDPFLNHVYYRIIVAPEIITLDLNIPLKD